MVTHKCKCFVEGMKKNERINEQLNPQLFQTNRSSAMTTVIIVIELCHTWQSTDLPVYAHGSKRQMYSKNP